MKKRTKWTVAGAIAFALAPESSRSSSRCRRTIRPFSGAVAALLMAVAIVVTPGPALSAARADVNVALRAE